jgi:hypothetical protein
VLYFICSEAVAHAHRDIAELILLQRKAVIGAFGDGSTAHFKADGRGLAANHFITYGVCHADKTLFLLLFPEDSRVTDPADLDGYDTQ